MRCTLNPSLAGAVCTGMTNITSINLNIVGTGPAGQSQKKHKFPKGKMFWTWLLSMTSTLFHWQQIQLGSFIDKKPPFSLPAKCLTSAFKPYQLNPSRWTSSWSSSSCSCSCCCCCCCSCCCCFWYSEGIGDHGVPPVVAAGKVCGAVGQVDAAVPQGD